VKLIKVFWNDAIADSCWTCEEDLIDKRTPNCFSIGYLIQETLDAYIITSTITDGHDVMGYTIIPKGLTTKVEYL
jgi:hypothetical protein